MNKQEFKTLIKKDGYKYLPSHGIYEKKNCPDISVDDIIIILLDGGEILSTYNYDGDSIDVVDFHNKLNIMCNLYKNRFYFNISDILPSLNYYIRQIKLNQLLARQYNNLVHCRRRSCFAALK